MRRLICPLFFHLQLSHPLHRQSASCVAAVLMKRRVFHVSPSRKSSGRQPSRADLVSLLHATPSEKGGSQPIARSDPPPLLLRLWSSFPRMRSPLPPLLRFRPKLPCRPATQPQSLVAYIIRPPTRRPAAQPTQRPPPPSPYSTSTPAVAVHRSPASPRLSVSPRPAQRSRRRSSSHRAARHGARAAGAREVPARARLRRRRRLPPPHRRRGPGRHAAGVVLRVPLLLPGGAGGGVVAARAGSAAAGAAHAAALHRRVRARRHRAARLRHLRGAARAGRRGRRARRPAAPLRRGRARRHLGRVPGLRGQEGRRHRVAGGHGGRVRQGVPGRGGGGHGARDVRGGDEVHGPDQGRARGGEEEGGRGEDVRRRGHAGRRARGPRERPRLHGHLQGSLHGASRPPRPARGRGLAAVARRLPRRPPGPPPRPGARAVRAGLPPGGLPPGAVPRLLQPHVPGAPGPPHVPADGDPALGARRAAAGAAAGRAGVAVRVQPPHGAGPDHHLHRAGAAGDVRHLQREPAVDGDLADPRGGADAGQGGGRGAHVGAAGGGRRGCVPRGHHVPGALPAALLGALRGAHGQDRARGAGGEAGHLLRLHGARVEVDGPILLLHEPAPGVPRHLPAGAEARRDVRRRREERRRRRQPRAEGHRKGARLRVHHAYKEGQVHEARRQRRHR
ncbi:hypothetical protein U9M48_025938 [Paspalum notatum var. saurae]|uniref:Uncharacterized protein n=1 Tax=Paspalum notatum var. saurae TaxID=547442 RepID=A0AAQ3TUB9_PASNO